MSRKIRCDATLQNLPPERQAQIIEWCDTPKQNDCPGGFKYAREQLSADGMEVSERALSRFWQWYNLRELYESAAVEAEAQKEELLKFDPDDANRAEAFGDYVFLQRTLGMQDVDGYVAVSKLREARKQRELKTRHDTATLALQERRVLVLEAKMKDATEALTDPTGSAESRIAKMRQIFGIA